MRALTLRLTMAAALILATFACDETEDRRTRVVSNGDADGGSGSGSDPTPSSDDPTPGDGEAPPEKNVVLTHETMEFADQTRIYLLAKPTDYDASKTYPLVLAFHGNPGSAEGMAHNIPFDAVSKRDAVIVYPQAASVDGGGFSWDQYTPTDANADMNFVRALVDEVATKANIDQARVFGFGYSGGAFFITQMACRFTGFFTAISVNAGGGPDEQQMGYAQHENGCYECPGGPTPTIVTHGAADTGVDPSSGAFTADCFATTNGCSMDRSPTTPAPCQRYDGCPVDKPVEWCLIPGQGHGLWSGARTEAWAFFSAL